MLSAQRYRTEHSAAGTEHFAFVVTIESNLDGVSGPALSRFLQRARRAAGLRGQAHVLIVSSARMRTLNSKYRGKNRPTDVLSFPAMPEIAQDFAGDIVISSEIAWSNARRLGHPVSDELRVLILHGILHLGGHDHESDNGEMARLERGLREQLGLDDSLIERSSKRQVRSAKKRKPVSARTSHLALGTSHSRRSR